MKPQDCTPVLPVRKGGEARRETLGGTVSPAEYAEVLAAFAAAGLVTRDPVRDRYLGTSDGVRAVLFAWSRSPAVREAVAAYWRTEALRPAAEADRDAGKLGRLLADR